MMKKTTSILALSIAVFLLSSCNQNKQEVSGDALFTDTQPNTIKVSKEGGKLVYEKGETHFDILELIGKLPATLVTTVTSTEKRLLGEEVEGGKSFLIKVRNLEGTEKIDWQKEVKAADIDFGMKLLTVHSPVKAALEDSYTFYNIRNGKKIMDFTYGELRVLIPNTSEKRFFGYLSSTNSLGEKVEGGIITYASSDGAIQKIALTGLKNLVPQYTPEMQILKSQDANYQITPDGKTIILPSLNQDFKSIDISGFAFKVVLYEENNPDAYEILLPISNDKIDLANAQYDKAKFTLKLID